jgi:hypothetical protein
MFLENSRYFNQPVMKRKLKDGRTVVLVQPRVLPEPEGVLTPLQANDRLDTIALRNYEDGTRFWHIADANSETEARRLTEPPEVSAADLPVPSIIIPRT